MTNLAALEAASLRSHREAVRVAERRKTTTGSGECGWCCQCRGSSGARGTAFQGQPLPQHAHVVGKFVEGEGSKGEGSARGDAEVEEWVGMVEEMAFEVVVRDVAGGLMTRGEEGRGEGGKICSLADSEELVLRLERPSCWKEPPLDLLNKGLPAGQGLDLRTVETPPNFPLPFHLHPCLPDLGLDVAGLPLSQLLLMRLEGILAFVQPVQQVLRAETSFQGGETQARRIGRHMWWQVVCGGERGAGHFLRVAGGAGRQCDEWMEEM